MLPDLENVRALDIRFDLIMITAVFMHLDAEQRAQTIKVLATLLSSKGRIAMSLRHGPVPKGRRMFDIGRAEVEKLAAENGLRLHPDVARENTADPFAREGISWSNYVLER